MAGDRSGTVDVGFGLCAGLGRPLEGRVLLDLVDGRHAEEDLLQPVVAERPVADLGRGLGDLLDAALLGDEGADLLGDEDELVDRDAALVAGAAALGAALAAVERDVREARPP
jgi:hypothetical protein